MADRHLAVALASLGQTRDNNHLIETINSTSQSAISISA